MEKTHYIIMEFFVSPKGYGYGDLLGVYHSYEEAKVELEILKPHLREKSNKHGFKIDYDREDGFVAGTEQYLLGNKDMIVGPPHIYALIM